MEKIFFIILSTIKTLFSILFYIVLMILEIIATLNVKETNVYYIRLIKTTLKRYKILLSNIKYF